jgi:pre-rRNA-processing protein TSR2
MDEAQAKFTHAIALIIHSWSALSIAVENEWAGPESSNIRDWLGGQIVDLFHFPPTPTKIPDAEYVEQLLTQIVEDEFELRLEDDSAYQVCALLKGTRAKG